MIGLDAAGGKEGKSCAELFQEALAPWESTEPIAFACEALRQVAAELEVLRAGITGEHDGPLDDELVNRALAGVANRASVAAEVAFRLWRQQREESEAAQ